MTHPVLENDPDGTSGASQINRDAPQAKPSPGTEGNPFRSPALFSRGSLFIWSGLGSLALSFKLFLTGVLGLAALCYLSLLSSIWNDTAMTVSIILEAYEGMSAIELTEHSFKYLFWFFGIFSPAGLTLMFSSCPEKWKRFFAAAVPAVIVSDIACAWLISLHIGFAYLLFASGLTLAGLFLTISFLILRELWAGKKNPA